MSKTIRLILGAFNFQLFKNLTDIRCFLVQDQPNGTFWRITSEYGPIWLCLLICITSYLAVLRDARAIDNSTLYLEQERGIKV